MEWMEENMNHLNSCQSKLKISKLQSSLSGKWSIKCMEQLIPSRTDDFLKRIARDSKVLLILLIIYGNTHPIKNKLIYATQKFCDF